MWARLFIAIFFKVKKVRKKNSIIIERDNERPDPGLEKRIA
jgi:hypothetical protein